MPSRFSSYLLVGLLLFANAASAQSSLFPPSMAGGSPERDGCLDTVFFLGQPCLEMTLSAANSTVQCRGGIASCDSHERGFVFAAVAPTCGKAVCGTLILN